MNMEALKYKKLIYNPVLHAPWKVHFNKVYQEPDVLTENEKSPAKKHTCKPNLKATRRLANMETLMKRFPGLKRYEARAALTLSKDELEKAIILLEVSKSYQQNVTKKNKSLMHLKNIRINLVYDLEEYNPTLRNVVLENFVSPNLDKSTQAIPVTPNLVDLRFSSENSPEARIGVAITKSADGYRATLL